jgi:hypothetical protein
MRFIEMFRKVHDIISGFLILMNYKSDYEKKDFSGYTGISGNHHLASERV